MDVKDVIDVVVGIVVTILLVVGFLFGLQYFKVFSAEMSGKAILAQATNERQAQVEQARAEYEAAQLRADAIAIVGEAAQKYPEYRYQEFLGSFAEAFKAGKINQVVYVPTEAMIPIMEAGKR